jgi:hypothetical protein
MAGKKSSGTMPWGDSPMSKIKLEGPKKHHDFHGNDASRPMKGNGPAVPEKHWEKHYSLNEPSRNMYVTEGADFAPKKSDMRKTTHLKVNDTDH